MLWGGDGKKTWTSHGFIVNIHQGVKADSTADRRTTSDPCTSSVRLAWDSSNILVEGLSYAANDYSCIRGSGTLVITTKIAGKYQHHSNWRSTGSWGAHDRRRGDSRLLVGANGDNAAQTKVKITSCLATELRLKGHFIPCYIILLREIFMLQQ